MIAGLKGVVETVDDDGAVIYAGGVGYLVFASGRTLRRLMPGEAAALLIETHVREDHIHLYGFLDRIERDWFRLLTTVQGVGARVALAILGQLSSDELTRAIASGDKGAMTRAPGVGPKLATRILSELKEKAGMIALGQAAHAAKGAKGAKGGKGDATAVAPDLIADAVSALVNLGYAPSEAFGAIGEASSELGPSADIARLIKGGLTRLAPADTRAGGR
ncbi:MAG: Holliday junction branch migration protein RuvA [Proteobacteria bacterium]|nr:Holliday junction branch migration protein RuvA [Pseudomonadota bacterium]